MRFQKGCVYLVGAGPGDPKLLTIRGQELLVRADLVVYDHLVNRRLLGMSRPGTTFVYVGKQAKAHKTPQTRINTMLIRAAKKGHTVVRLKGGDPILFGRGGEEAMALSAAGVRFEIVPGVTSATAVPAYAGIPVTHRELSSSVTIATGHEDPSKPGNAIRWDHLARGSDTLILLMSVETLPAMSRKLIQHGRRAQTPCAVIERGTVARQRTITGTLGTIGTRARRAQVQAPAVLVVGAVVKLRETLNWFERRPLFGKRILVTRPAEKAHELTDQLEAFGAEVETLPAIELAPVASRVRFRHAVQELGRTDWVFFTSPEGIGWFSRMLKPLGKDLRTLGQCRIGAIGPKTAAALEHAGVQVDFMPRRYSQEGMVSDLPRRILRGKRATIFCAEDSREALAAGLRVRGATVRKVAVYRTMVPTSLSRRMADVLDRPFDAVTVTSASCVEHLFRALEAVGEGGRFRSLRFASIGPVTSQAVRRLRGRVALEARTSTIDGLVQALIDTGSTSNGRHDD